MQWIRLLFMENGFRRTYPVMGSLSGSILGWQTVQSGNGMVFFYFLQNWDTCRLLELYVKKSRKSNKKRQKNGLDNLFILR